MNNKFVTYNSVSSAITDTSAQPLISPVNVTIYDGNQTYHLVSDDEEGIETYVARSSDAVDASPILVHPFYVKTKNSQGGSLQFVINTTREHPKIEYRFHGQTTWSEIRWVKNESTNETYSNTINLTYNVPVYLKGNISNTSTVYTKIKGDFTTCGGLLCKIGNKENYATLTSYQFYNLFEQNINLQEAKLQLRNPLSIFCYAHMFQSCNNLVTAPELPATTLASSCYYYMFAGCTRLVTAPELPAKITANTAYGYMFNNCTSLRFIKCNIESFESSDNCCSYWVTGVPNREPASSISNTELGNRGVFIMNKTLSGGGWKSGQSGVPHGWVTLSYK